MHVCTHTVQPYHYTVLQNFYYYCYYKTHQWHGSRSQLTYFSDASNCDVMHRLKDGDSLIWAPGDCDASIKLPMLCEALLVRKYSIHCHVWRPQEF